MNCQKTFSLEQKQSLQSKPQISATFWGAFLYPSVVLKALQTILGRMNTSETVEHFLKTAPVNEHPPSLSACNKKNLPLNDQQRCTNSYYTGNIDLKRTIQIHLTERGPESGVKAVTQHVSVIGHEHKASD